MACDRCNDAANIWAAFGTSVAMEQTASQTAKSRGYVTIRVTILNGRVESTMDVV